MPEALWDPWLMVFVPRVVVSTAELKEMQAKYIAMLISVTVALLWFLKY